MPSSRLLLTAVPAGLDNGQGLLTVLVSPQLNTAAEMKALNSWTQMLKDGKVQFKLDIQQGYYSLDLRTTALQPDLWPKIFKDAPFAPFGQELKISKYKVNLKVTRDHAIQLHKGFVNRPNHSVGYLRTLHQNAARQHGYYAHMPSASAEAAKLSAIPSDVVVTRITGRSSLTNYSASDVSAEALEAMLSMDDIDATQKHILHHVHRLSAAPRNHRSDTLDPRFLPPGAKAPANPQMDFHQRISLLMNMPPLMDALGLVLTFLVPQQLLTGLQQVRVVSSTSAFTDPQTNVSIPFASPITNLDPARFLPKKATSALTDAGWINPSDDYHIDSLQLDSAAMQIYQFSNASALRQTALPNSPEAASAGPNSDVLSNHNEDHSHPILPPSPHTGGLTVWQHERQKKVRDKVQKTATTTLDDGTPLNAEDLIAAIAVDVKVASSGDWVHLTRRNELYQIGGNVIKAQDREHGVRTAATRRSDTTQSQGNDFDIDETIFTWKLGSLVVKADTQGSDPIKSQGTDRRSSQVLPWSSGAQKKMSPSSPVPSPLFGETYSIAMHPVYVTGRPAPFDAQTAQNNSLPPTKFLRYELVQGPAVIPVKFTSHYSELEHRTLLIAGSKLDKNLAPHTHIPKSLRALVPMSVAPDVARRHGKTDQQLAKGATVFQLINGTLPEQVQKPDGDSTGTYLPDPLATGVLATLLDISDEQLAQLTTPLNYYDHETWPNYTVHFVELQTAGNVDPPSLSLEDFDGVPAAFPFPIRNSKKIVCRLPPGTTAVLQLTPALAGNVSDLHALAPLLEGSQTAQSSDICRPTFLRLSHATDLPIALPDVLVSDEHGHPASPALDRGNKNTSTLAVEAEPYSTSKVAVLAEWTDSVDDITQAKPVERPSKARLTDFSIGKNSSAGQWSDPQTIQLPFADTRYRQVKITPVGTARLADVFLKDRSQEPPTLPGTAHAVDFIATAAPPLPDVQYIVPTLQWSFAKGSHTRTMGLSVILNRPWYASGNGEQLAVIIGSSANGGPPIRNLLPTIYGTPNQEDSQSAWGLHPDWAGYADWPANLDGVGITVGPGSSTIPVVQDSVTKYIVPFTPQYNEQDRQWFCNVKLTKPPAYGAVVRLLLARYQPMARDNCKLSPITACDFALLGPERTLSVTRTGHIWNRKVQIRINGVGAYVKPKNTLMTTFQVFRASLSLTNTQDFNWLEENQIPTDSGFVPQGALLWQGTVSPGFLEDRAVLVRELETYPCAEDPTKSRTRVVYVDLLKL